MQALECQPGRIRPIGLFRDVEVRLIDDRRGARSLRVIGMLVLPGTGNCVFSVLGVDQFRLKLESLGQFYGRKRGDAP